MGGGTHGWGHRKGLEASVKLFPQKAVILMDSNSTQETGSWENAVIDECK